MPAGFRRHLVAVTLINVFHCNIAEVRFVGNLAIIQTFSRTNRSNVIKITRQIFAPYFTHYTTTLYPKNRLRNDLYCVEWGVNFTPTNLYPQNGDRIVAIDSVTSLHHD